MNATFPSGPSLSRWRRHASTLSLCAGLALAGTAVCQDARGQDAIDQEKGTATDPVIVGEGAHTYRWIKGWGLRPDSTLPGSTHGGVAVDRAGRIYANTDGDDGVMVFNRDGALQRTLGGAELAGGVHGIAIVVETVEIEGKPQTQEFLYLAHQSRREVVKTTLAGEVLWTLGCPMESGHYEKVEQYRPTAVAVAPDGRIYVADGYGQSWVHVFDSNRNYLMSFGGKGTAKDQFRTCHGLFMDTRGETPELVVCDRENHRVKWYSLDGELLRMADEGLGRPCNITPLTGPRADHWAIADLTGRVTILGADLAVVCHLGQQPEASRRATNQVDVEHWRDGEFLSPHGIACDSHGDLYVLDWSRYGRFTRLTPHR